MNRARAYREATAMILRDRMRFGPIEPLEQDVLDEEVEHLVEDWYADATEEFREDSPCLQSCDMWGTGEGRYHGVIA